MLQKTIHSLDEAKRNPGKKEAFFAPTLDCALLPPGYESGQNRVLKRAFDLSGSCLSQKTLVIPANAGFHKHYRWSFHWIPACAGMTKSVIEQKLQLKYAPLASYLLIDLGTPRLSKIDSAFETLVLPCPSR